MWFELHKHSQYSLFDGFGRIQDIVEYAKELGMPALGLSDHGNTAGVAKLYFECNKAGIKPIIGVEAYFQPRFNKDKPYYHLCLFAQNQTGYSNIMQIITYANEHNFYRRGIVTFDLLEKYNAGVICTSACIGGIVSQAIVNNNDKLAIKATKRFKRIFDDNFYFEIMPIPLDEVGLQELANKELYSLGKTYNVKCIPTTDSHYTRHEDFETYKVMHALSGKKSDVEATYGARHMHSEKEIKAKLLREFTKKQAREMLDNLEEIYDKVDIQLDFSDSVPVFPDTNNAYKDLKKKCINELKARGLANKEYIERLKLEANVIKNHNLADYFLIVADYVEEAKRRNIYVGPGRGSVCGSLIADLLGITNVDPIEIGNDFERFLRADKKKMPDIDLDFEYGLRDEIIEYLLEKYKGHSAQVITFGFYRVKNLCNDFIKHFEMDEEDAKIFKSTLDKNVDDKAHFEFEGVDYNKIIALPEMRRLEKQYSNIITHFCKLYGQVRYYGTHAAGVVITRNSIGSYMSLMKVKGKFVTCFDKYDIEAFDFLKFDILGLKTLNIIHEIEELTGDKYDTRTASKKQKQAIYDGFKTGKTMGIFQLNKPTAQDILVSMEADNIQDLIAAVSLNRPGPLQLQMHTHYAENKIKPNKSTPWYRYTADSYGTIIYQEHVMRICKGLAQMHNDDVDKIMKFKFNEEQRLELKDKFVEGANKISKVNKQEAAELFDSMTLYLFNKGHGSGYALISEWQMYHKIFHPAEFWYASMKYSYDKTKDWQFRKDAAKDGIVIFLPHVNYSADYSLRKVDGEKVIQEGLITINGVGLKAAEYIENERKENGPYKSIDEFVERCRSRAVHKGVINSLVEHGAAEFNMKRYLSRVIKYNASLICN